MEKTLNKYRTVIQSGEADPVARWDGKSSKIIFDPSDPKTPVDYAGLAVWKLEQGPFELRTGEQEYVLIPLSGEFEVAVEGVVFAGCRPGGPFAAQPELSNASAVYLGRNQTCTLSGLGEMIGFSAPAFADKPPVFIKPGEIKQQSRGEGIWHREVITLVTTEDVSTNMTVGETYCPPGRWAGTPMHVHDKDDLPGGQSDYEVITYHMARITEGRRGGFGVQLMFDDQGLDKAFRVQDRAAVAIPGGAHPVVAGPDSDMIFVWASVSDKKI